MSMLDEFTTTFGNEFHTRAEYGTNVGENYSVDHLPITKRWLFWIYTNRNIEIQHEDFFTKKPYSKHKKFKISPRIIISKSFHSDVLNKIT